MLLLLLSFKKRRKYTKLEVREEESVKDGEAQGG